MGFYLGDIVEALRTCANPCWRKERHASQGAALAHMRSLLKTGREKDASRINVYRCKFCGTWHVGHSMYQTEE